MFFKPKRKDIARRGSMEFRELQSFDDFPEAHYLAKPMHKELSLFSKKNYTYADNRKITVVNISNCTFVIKL